MEYHNPVLLKEAVDALNINPEGIYVDVTFGGGGHSREIISRLTTGKLYAFDRDEDAVKNAIKDERFVLIRQSFRYLKNFLKIYKAVPVNGILADLGVSSHQFDVAERGFSTRFEGPLDMRMDRSSGKSAADVVNSYEEKELKRIFAEYGELKNAGKVAYQLVNARNAENIATTGELKRVLANCTNKFSENKFFAQVFQALRIEVNNELDALKEMLVQGNEVLVKGGRLVVISYHSLEDRLVKNFMKTGNFEGKLEKDFYGNPLVPLKPTGSKLVVPSEEEIRVNSRARSAKMRVAEKL